jgi:hypothetical protein
MKFSEIIRKSKVRICNPTTLERAMCKDAFDIENLAIRKIANQDVAAKIIGALSNPGVTAGIGATALGAGSLLSSSQKENETEEEFKSRRMNSAIANAIAGGAIGGAAPIAVDALKSLVPQERSPVKDALKFVGGQSLFAGGAAGAMGVVDRIRASSFLEKDPTKINPALRPKTEWAKSVMAPFKNHGLKVLDPAGKKMVDLSTRSLLTQKFKHPLIAAAAAVLLPLALKKTDQAISM